MSVEAIPPSFTEKEKTVLYYKCKGLNYEQIASRLGYSVEWVTLQMSYVYQKLGLRKDMHWTKRTEFLKNEICPKIPKDLKSWLEEVSAPEIASGEIKEVIKEDPQFVAIVMYDEMMITEEKEKSLKRVPTEVIVIKGKKDSDDGKKKFGRFLFAFVATIIVSTLAIFFYRMGLNQRQATIVQAVTQVITEILPTPMPSLTLPPVPTSTLAPTLTPLPPSTFTAIPTEFIPPADGILFRDSFDTSISPEWTTYGNWIVSNGELHMVADEGDVYNWISLYRPYWKNYILSVKINIPFQGSAAQSYIAVTVRDGSNSKRIGVPVDYFSNVYWAFVGLDHFDDIAIAGENRDYGFSSGSTLMLKAENDIFTVSVNGIEVQSITISGFDFGGISLGVECYYTLGCPSFDNVMVTYLP